MLSRGLARWPAALAFLLFYYVLLIVGLIFFIVPGIVIMVMGLVSLPVCIIERRGPFRSFSRSVDLTEGHRWPLFVIAILVLVLSLGGNLIVQRLLTPFSTELIVAQFVWQALALALGAILGTAAYIDLRAAKEGVDVAELAAVFD